MTTKENNLTEQISIRLTPADYTEFVALSKRTNKPMAVLLRAYTKYLLGGGVPICPPEQ